jgi:RNA polymerase sigma-70 factor (ECF subfamily)
VTDEELARFHAGDERLFAALVREHSPRMLALARRLGADPDDAADALQDAWLRAYQRRRAAACEKSRSCRILICGCSLTPVGAGRRRETRGAADRFSGGGGLNRRAPPRVR